MSCVVISPMIRVLIRPFTGLILMGPINCLCILRTLSLRLTCNTHSLLSRSETVPWVIDAGDDLQFVSLAAGPVCCALNNMLPPELDCSIQTRDAVRNLHGWSRSRPFGAISPRC